MTKKTIEQAYEELRQIIDGGSESFTHDDAVEYLKDKLAHSERELVTWRNAAIRVGEDLCSVGPLGYYDMTAKQWLDWALNVVTVHAPPPQPKEPEQEPVAWRAWFDADNSAKWLFTLWPEEEHPSFDWQPLYTHPPVPTALPEQKPSYATAWLSGHAQGLEDGVAMKLKKPLVTPFGLPLFWDAPAPLPDGSLINEGTKNIEQEPAFYGFMDEQQCCVNICYTPWAAGGPNNKLPTAYYTAPPQPKEPEQEPVAWAENNGEGNVLWDKESCFSDDPDWLDNPMPLYTTPPQRKPLTDEQVREITKRYALSIAFPYDNPTTPEMFARAIEAAHGIKE